MFAKCRFATGLIACLLLCLVPVAGAQTTGAESVAASDKKARPELNRLVTRVWAQSPAIQAAHEAVESARAGIEGAGRPLYNPSLELDAERTDVSTLTIGVNQTLDWGDKRRSRTGLAEAELGLAEAELMAIRQRIAVETLSSLVRYQTARQMQALSSSRTRLMRHFAETVRRRFHAGDMQALDVSLANLALSEALMQQAEASGELAESQAALQAVTGLAQSSWPDMSALSLPSPDRGAVSRLVPERIPAVMLAKRRWDIASARVDLAKRERQADPTVGLRGGRDGSSGLIGVSLELPLFVRNDFSATVKGRRHDASGAAASFREAVRRARSRLVGSLGRFESMVTAWDQWLASGRQAHARQMSLLDQLWKAGELTATDYLIQAKQSVEAQATAKRLNGEVWLAAIDWLDASGQIVQWLDNGMHELMKTNSGEKRR